MKILQLDTPRDNNRGTNPSANSVICEKETEDISNDITESVITSTASYKDIKINPSIPVKDKDELVKVLQNSAPIFLDIPGRSKTVKHHIKLTSDVPFKIRLYPIHIQY